MRGILQITEGAGAVLAGAAATFFGGPGGAAIGHLLITAGAGMALSGVGSMIAGTPARRRDTTAEHNPISPWNVLYGTGCPKVTEIYRSVWGGGATPVNSVWQVGLNLLGIGGSNAYPVVDLVLSVDCHESQAITEILFDKKRLQIDLTAVPTSASAGYTILPPAMGSGSSFTPVQQTLNIDYINRNASGVVTVAVPNDIPYLNPGDTIQITHNHNGAILDTLGLTGGWVVAQTYRGGTYPPGYAGPFIPFTSTPNDPLIFTFVNGGAVCTVDNEGQAATVWPDFGRTVYVEPLYGNQPLGQTFIGMTAGTPWSGTGPLITPYRPGPAGGNQNTNPWTNFASGQGKTLLFIRIILSPEYYGAGLPQISVVVQGKSDIYDPRLGPLSGIGTIQKTSTTDSGYVASGLYAAGDILNVVQGGASGGQIQVTSSDATGKVLTWRVYNYFYAGEWIRNTGTGYTLGPATVTGGHGTGFTLTITSLTGAASDTFTGPNQWTANAALCIADFLNNPVWGYGIPYGAPNVPGGEFIPIPWLIWAANVCDTPAALAAGGTEPQWQCNGEFTTAQLRGAVLQDMLTSCAGRLTTVGGQYVIHPACWPTAPTWVADNAYLAGAWFLDVASHLQLCTVAGTSGGTEPVNDGGGTVTDGSATWQDMGLWPAPVNLLSIAAGPFKWSAANTVRELYNGCKGTYVSPANRWQSTDYPYYAQDADHNYNVGNSTYAAYNGDANLKADGGDRRWIEMHLQFTTSSRQAQQTAKIALLRTRWAGAGAAMPTSGHGTFAVTMAGYQYTPLDVLSASHAFLSWAAQTLEVVNARFGITGRDNRVSLGIELDVQATDASIYAWSVYEELSLQGYQQTILTQGQAAETQPWALSPGNVAPLAGDAVYPEGETGPGTFGLLPVYGTDVQGNATAAVEITTHLPFNNLAAIAEPQVTVTPSATGGSLVSGTYMVGVTAASGSGSGKQYSDYLAIHPVVIPAGTTTGSIALSIVWGPGDVGGDVYIAPGYPFTPAQIAQQAINSYPGYQFHWNQTVTSTSTTATITTFDQSQPGGPDPMFDHLRVLFMEDVHAGAWSQQVQAVTATTITIGGVGMTANLLAGRVLSLLAKLDPTKPIIVLNIPIASNTASNGGGQFTVTIGANSAGHTLPDLTTLLTVGDLLCLRFVGLDAANPTSGYFGATSFTDTQIANIYYPTGDDPSIDTNIGRYVAVVLTGIDAGDVQPISGVSESVSGSGKYDTYNLVNGWLTPPQTGDIVIICDPATAFNWPSGTLTGTNLSANQYSANPVTQNLARGQWLVTVRTESVNGIYGPDAAAPMRELVLFGGTGTLPLFSFSVDGTLAIEADACPALTLPATITPSGLLATVKTAPVGHDLDFSLWVGSVLWMSFTIYAGSTSATATSSQLTGKPITGGQNIRLSIDNVGSTTPGSDLSVILYR